MSDSTVDSEEKRQIAREKRAARKAARKEEEELAQVATASTKSHGTILQDAKHHYLHTVTAGSSKNSLRLDFDLNTKRFTAIAKKTIDASQTISEALPLASAVLDSSITRYCHRCFAEAKKMHICDGCNFARFCGPDCINSSRAMHQKECKTLAKLDEIFIPGESASFRMLLRLLHLRAEENSLNGKNKRKGAGSKANQKQLTVKQFSDLPMRPFDDVIASATNKKNQTLLSHDLKVDLKRSLQKLKEIAPAEIFPKNIDQAFVLLCRIRYHMQLISEPVGATLKPFNASNWSDSQFVAVALYPHSIAYRQSCSPNTIMSISPKTGAMVLRSFAEIKEGEEITFSKIDVFQHYNRRQQQLRDANVIRSIETCSCTRCSEMTASLLSPENAGSAATRGNSTANNGILCPGCQAATLPREVFDAWNMRHKIKKAQAQQKGGVKKLSASDYMHEKNLEKIAEANDRDVFTVTHTCSNPACKKMYDANELKTVLTRATDAEEAARNTMVLGMRFASMADIQNESSMIVRAQALLESEIVDGDCAQLLHPGHHIFRAAQSSLAIMARDKKDFQSSRKHCRTVIKNLVQSKLLARQTDAGDKADTATTDDDSKVLEEDYVFVNDAFSNDPFVGQVFFTVGDCYTGLWTREVDRRWVIGNLRTSKLEKQGIDPESDEGKMTEAELKKDEESKARILQFKGRAQEMYRRSLDIFNVSLSPDHALSKKVKRHLDVEVETADDFTSKKASSSNNTKKTKNKKKNNKKKKRGKK